MRLCQKFQSTAIDYSSKRRTSDSSDHYDTGFPLFSFHPLLEYYLCTGIPWYQCIHFFLFFIPILFLPVGESYLVPFHDLSVVYGQEIYRFSSHRFNCLTKNVRIQEKFPQKCRGKKNEWFRFKVMWISAINLSFLDIFGKTFHVPY